MKRPQFGIRLLFLITALAAILVAWVRVSFEAGRPEQLQRELNHLEAENDFDLRSTDAQAAERQARIEELRKELWNIGEQVRHQ